MFESAALRSTMKLVNQNHRQLILSPCAWLAHTTTAVLVVAGMTSVHPMARRRSVLRLLREYDVRPQEAKDEITGKT